MSASLWVKTSAVVNELSSPPPFKKTTFVFFESLPVRGIRVSRMINFCLLLFRFASAESGRLRRLRRRPVVVVPQLRRRKQNPPTKTFQFVRLVPSFFCEKKFFAKKEVFFLQWAKFLLPLNYQPTKKYGTRAQFYKTSNLFKLLFCAVS